MSATLSKLRTSWVGKALLAYAVSALALVVLGLAAPGSAVFFPLVSLCRQQTEYYNYKQKFYYGKSFFVFHLALDFRVKAEIINTFI